MVSERNSSERESGGEERFINTRDKLIRKEKKRDKSGKYIGKK